MFKEIPGEFVVVYRRGAFKQLPLYTTRSGQLFTKDGTRFYALKAEGYTSDPNLMVCYIERDAPTYRGTFDRLTSTKTNRVFEVHAFNKEKGMV